MSLSPAELLNRCRRRFPSAAWLPGADTRWAARLLDLELFCLGQDIRYSEGNLLLRRGLQASRPPEVKQGCTAYQAMLADAGADEGARLVLWGFGVFVSAVGRGGVFIKRFGFSPLFTPIADLPPVWEPAELPPLQPPQGPHEVSLVRQLLPLACRWLAAHETWILSEIGLEYRHTVLRAFPKKPVVAAAELPAAWECLAELCTARPVGSTVKQQWLTGKATEHAQRPHQANRRRRSKSSR